MNLFFLKHEKKVYLDLKEALLIRREENVLILRRLCTDFQKRRKCTKFEKLMYIFVIKKKNLRRREEFKKKMYIPIFDTLDSNSPQSKHNLHEGIDFQENSI